MDKCPVCKHPLTIEEVASEVYDTLEKYVSCRQGCRQYGYEFQYGNWRITLGTTELIGTYDETKTKRKKNYFIYNRKLARVRKQYRKQKNR